ncbi:MULTISPECIES: hypothetical protein [Dorea]|uniref:Uncharacterized protein n=1 Tax=Dorea longicatena TaxID=88431 RepID=A0AAP7DWZ7_9FIRM|nr:MULTISPECIES: hypothetical protein [Dorea]MCB5913374.1 hypothetical protein [Lachnospiraceae bacterium 210521-DFI.5.19]MBS1441153.1 hypothetical protein [Dorea sp.]MCG4796603.1 hypothetical protein [Dorea longicatena]MCM1894839.1 hypothetical protein [Dorea sp. MB18-49]MCQ4891563.1 hypothetical protein [Dorea longicatena]
MKLRNVKVAKRLGTKTLAGLLAFGLVVGTPSVVLADVQSTMSQSEALWNRSIWTSVMKQKSRLKRMVRINIRQQKKR